MKRTATAKAVALTIAAVLVVSCAAQSSAHVNRLYEPLSEPFTPIVESMPVPAPQARLRPSPSPTARPTRANPEPTAVAESKIPRATAKPRLISTRLVSTWHLDPNISWYGPGFYGHRTACGLTLTTTLIGVANRTLPCGALIRFRYNGVTVTAPVVDRGPYVTGRQWDMTGGLCLALRHCFTGAIEWSR